MLENVVFSWVPTDCTAAMMTTEMPAAMRPYSIAVAPDSSLRNATKLGLKTVKLPIDDYVSIEKDQSLNVNHGIIFFSQLTPHCSSLG